MIFGVVSALIQMEFLFRPNFTQYDLNNQFPPLLKYLRKSLALLNGIHFVLQTHLSFVVHLHLFLCLRWRRVISLRDHLVLLPFHQPLVH